MNSTHILHVNKLGNFKGIFYQNERAMQRKLCFFLKVSNFLKETITQVFSCKHCAIFNNSFSYRTTPVAASPATILLEINPQNLHHTEVVVRRYSVKMVFLEISQNSQENTCTRASFLIKLQAWGFFFKKRLWHSCFPVNFANCYEYLFLQKTSGGCFWPYRSKLQFNGKMEHHSDEVP